MNKYKKVWTFYCGMLLFFGVLIYVVVLNGKNLETKPELITGPDSLSSAINGGFQGFINTLWHNICEPGALLLLQMVTILLFARFMGFIFSKFHQPTVVGEILAGIILGPSLFGKFFPEGFNFLFSRGSLDSIYILSQIGLILFMFIIGMEINLGTLKEKIREVYVISHASIVFSFFMGMLLAYLIYQEFAASMTGFLPFSLFIGISMSITAFPVLARIIQERDLTRTHLGTMTLASAAIDDVTAWCLLAAVIAIASTGSFVSSLYTLVLLIIYAAVMLYVVRPFLKKLGDAYRTNELVNKKMMAFIFLMLLISAYATQIIGIHALFGAFLAGVVMPPLTNFRKIVVEKIEDVSVSLLMPLFFVFTGLRTEIGLLNTPHLWWTCAFVVMVAIIGKFGGTTFSAKVMGENWRDSISMGIMMNTRGLMELIVLNIGYEMGILPPVVFVMLVIMTLVTTFMTTPMMSLMDKLMPVKNKHQALMDRLSLGIFNALVAVGNPDNGKPLINVAKTLLDGFKNSLSVTVLHITVGTDLNPYSEDEFSEESFKGVRAEADRLGIPIETQYKVTDNISHEIISTTNDDNYDFLLVGAGSSISKTSRRKSLLKRIPVLNKFFSNISESKAVFYPGALIRDKSRVFIESCDCSVGIFVNRDFSQIKKTMILIGREEDVFLFKYARRLIRNNSQVNIRIMDPKGLATISKPVAQGILHLITEYPDSVKMCKSTLDKQPYMKEFSFMLISYQSWNYMAASENNELEFIPSTLIINKKQSRFHNPQETTED
jgi:Kef-type K+ transport system membrane component KefB